MKVIVSKILNKTDLAQSGSHGGLVVTKADQTALKNFFERSGKDQKFIDRSDGQEYNIHYQDYTSNGTTPNDRITPIGKYAGKHHLRPGDLLILCRTNHAGGGKSYEIDYLRKADSVFFKGKSKILVDALNYGQLGDLLARWVQSGVITKKFRKEFVMRVCYLGRKGSLRLVQHTEGFELYFQDTLISENNKYFELDTSLRPFMLRKTNTWRIAMEADGEEADANEEAEAKLVHGVANIGKAGAIGDYRPVPEAKGQGTEICGRKVASRSKTTAENALARAEYQCELGEHETFLRKKSLLPYTEPHHLIPLQFDEQFAYSLDVQANIVSLCSTCHNQIHYGAEAERLIRQLWEQRKEELAAAGLCTMKNGVELTVDLLLSFYGI